MTELYDITDDVKRDVLRATDLVTLVGSSTSLRKVGRSWKGLCPFHGEKTPSFYVHPDKGFYYCFGCGAKGDAITFVRETERLDFPEAVAYLARQAGISLPVRRSGARADRAKETRAAEALAAAAAFFRESLARHDAARALLSRRGLSVEEAPGYGIGAAPDSWDALRSALSGRIAEEALLQAGLLQRHPETGRVYDRFRNRLMIEIRDGRGEVLGFGARALGEEQPKYLNSPESPRFSKGKLLYGLDRARDAVRKGDEILLVEGYFDRIAMERAGCLNAVASMGTALTPAQADLLTRLARTVTVAYDGDPAGRAASWKAFPLLLARGSEVKDLVLPDGHDPDSFLATHGAEALRSRAQEARPVVESLVAVLPSPSSDPAERARRLNEAATILRETRDPVLRHEYLSALSRASGVPLAALTQGPAEARRAPERPSGPSFEDLPEAERKVLEVLLEEWPESAPLVSRVPLDIFTHPVAREVFVVMKELDPLVVTLDFSALQSHLGQEAGLVVARLLLAGSESGEDEKAPGGESGGLGRLHKPLLLLKIRQLEERAKNLTLETRAAENKGDTASKAQLLAEKRALVPEIERLKKEFRRK